MKNKFVIVDGSSMLSTCYYAVLPREIMFAKTEEEKQKHYGPPPPPPHFSPPNIFPHPPKCVMIQKNDKEQLKKERGRLQ